MSRRAFFLINGLGMGNSTRCHAVIQRLLDRDFEVAIATSGNGLWYFRDQLNFPRVTEIEELHYGKKEGRLSIAATFASLGEFARVMRRNAETISSALREFSPDVIVSDSIYTLKPIKKYGVPIISLNNADVIYKSYFDFDNKPLSILQQFYMIELMDYLFHKLVPDGVISPSLDEAMPCGASNFQRVGPIVRKGIESMEARGEASRVTIMLSGSTFGSEIRFKRDTFPVKIDIVGRTQPAAVSQHPNITYHGKVINSLELLRGADLLVVNGGFSAVSEGFVLRKPLLIIPVPNHAEQWINARTIEKMGVGIMCTVDNFEDHMFQALENLPQFIDAYNRLPLPNDAAAEAADFILKYTGKTR